MLIFFLKAIAQNCSDLINEVETKLKINNPTEALQTLIQIKDTNTISYKIVHAKYLYMTGEYEELVTKYGNESDIGIKTLVIKASNALNTLPKDLFQKDLSLTDLNKLESVFKESFMSKKFAKVLIQTYIKNKMFSKAKDISEMIFNSYPLDKEIKKTFGYTLCLTPFYNKGILILKELQMKEAFLFELILKEYNSTNTNESNKVLINKIKEIELQSEFVPSIFYYFKFNFLYFNYVKNMIGQNKPCTEEALELNEVIQENNSFYYLGKSYLLENRFNELNELLLNKKFTDYSLKSNLKYEKKRKERIMAEEEAKRKEKQREEERKREREEAERRKRTHRHDISGYYEILGVKNTATKQEINRAFKKKSLETNPEKYKSDKNEYERRLKLQMKINKAKDVLTDEKSRRLYDQGIDGDSPQAQDHFSQFRTKGNTKMHDVEDIFSAFFGNNDFGGSRRTRRTYYYYYG